MRGQKAHSVNRLSAEDFKRWASRQCESFEAQDVMGVFPLHRNSIQQILGRAVKAGTIVRIALGIYRKAPKPGAEYQE